jgi:gluconolactonase
VGPSTLSQPEARALERRLELVVVTDAHEGPVYVADEHALYFTTVRHERVSIKRLSLADGTVSVVRPDANTANGMTFDREGRLIVCEQGTMKEPARITRLDRRTREIETLVDSYGGLPLNSPNDVAVRSDGTIWFTDPSYGYLQGFRPEPKLGDHVYRYDPATGTIEVAAAGFDKPNGLAFAPDEHVLYVGDNGSPKELIAFDVADGRLSSRRVLATSSGDHPDGIKVDEDGRIYASSARGVEIRSPRGERLGLIDLPGAVTFTFGGPDRDVLYITADTAIWAAHPNAKGA